MLGRFPWWTDDKVSTCNAGDLGLIPGVGRSPAEGNGCPLQCSCLENPRDRGAWWAAIYGLHRVGHDRSDLAAAAALHIRWPKYWSFSISPSNEYSGLIYFRIDWFDLLAAQETLKSLLQHHSSKASILSLLFGPTLTSVHDYWKKYSFDDTDLCRKVMTLLFNTLSRFVTAFLPNCKCLLIS